MTDMVEIVEGSVTVSSTIAKDGDTVIVTAMATAGQEPLALIETVMAAGGLMTDSLTTPGTYTRSVLVATGTPDGTYTVTVSLGGEVETAADMLTVDNTDPDVTVTAPESAEDGETVMISAMVTDAGTVSSVTADVSALDSTQTMLTLAMAADGSYSAPLEISDEKRSRERCEDNHCDGDGRRWQQRNGNRVRYVGQQAVLHLDATNGYVSVPCAVG